VVFRGNGSPVIANGITFGQSMYVVVDEDAQKLPNMAIDHDFVAVFVIVLEVLNFRVCHSNDRMNVAEAAF
jgi:hypothetical protein